MLASKYAFYSEVMWNTITFSVSDDTAKAGEQNQIFLGLDLKTFIFWLLLSNLRVQISNQLTKN